ncbi:MAG: glycoside hydrolase family 36 protein, partial [Bacteroidota bacterium]
LDEDILLEEFAIAKDLGFELVIIDDGWQTLDTNRGYDYTGDWQPERMPEMRAFVDQVHALGMKIGLWFSVPFCGKHSQAFQDFAGEFLTIDHRWAPVFDPRYPEVREHLIGLYERAVRDWDMDALKLDFIDDFQVYEQTVLTKENGRDYASVNEAVHRLMSDVMKRLRLIKPEIAIEFRQKYIGPAMLSFGNMFRAFDCPNDPVSNRIRITDIKLLSGPMPVHADPFTWHESERIELAAFQFINALFAVPQLSIHLRNTDPAFLQMVRYFTEYWTEHRDILLDGDFLPCSPLANYPILQSTRDGHRIVGLYENMIVNQALGDLQVLNVFNASQQDLLVLRLEAEPLQWKISTYDCKGQLLSSLKQHLHIGLHEFSVPQGGRLSLSRSK